MFLGAPNDIFFVESSIHTRMYVCKLASHLGVRPIWISLDIVGYLLISLDIVGY